MPQTKEPIDGERVKALRLALGLSQKELGALAGVGQPTINKIEVGRAKWSRHDTVGAVAQALGVTEQALRVGGSRDELPPASVGAKKLDEFLHLITDSEGNIDEVKLARAMAVVQALDEADEGLRNGTGSRSRSRSARAPSRKRAS